MIQWLINWFRKEDTDYWKDEVARLDEQIEILKNKLLEKNEESDIEEYYNNKYPKSDVFYNGRQLLDNINQRVSVDIRNFFHPEDSEVKNIAEQLNGGEKTDDEKAHLALLYVIDNFKYVEDKIKGNTEYWQFPFESLHYRTGDCEDGAILLANIMIAMGIPAWKIRLTAGWVKYGLSKSGHAYLTYYCKETKRWVVLDWCYWPNRLEIHKREDYKNEKNYLDVWFSWTQYYCWTKGLNTEAKKVLKL